jgi:hypothetical protein
MTTVERMLEALRRRMLVLLRQSPDPKWARSGRNVGWQPTAIGYCNFKNIACEKGSVLVPSD